jgi:very-short-patch-repair endonuclease
VKCDGLYHLKPEIVDLYRNKNLSIKDLRKMYNCQSYDLKIILGENTRTLSEARKISSIRFKFSHSDETKEKMRISRLKYMKQNPEKTAWRKSNISYPEKLFLNKIEELGWYKKYRIEREYPMFPYFIDFAFINEKIALEIDGSQHLLPERKASDEKKDFTLTENGWSVIRVTENEIKTNLGGFINFLSEKINSSEKFEKQTIGIFIYKKQKPVRDKNGRTEKENTASLKQRKVERPNYDVLIEDIDNLGFRGTGRKYGVSDNAIRKWIKNYKNTH